MSEPYREAKPGCPQCASPLRAFQKRLVCDQCDGMMLSDEDYTASIRDLDGSAEVLSSRDPQPASEKCPVCAKPMHACEVSFGQIKLTPRYLHCEDDGYWVPNASMVAAYAVVAQRARRGGRRLGGGMGNAMMDVGGPGMQGMGIAMRSVRDAFSNRPSFVQFSNKPLVRTAFVSAFSGQELPCPACVDQKLVFEADRWACKGCTGSFVEDAALVAMVQDITQAYWEMPAVGAETGPRKCPTCAMPMNVELFQSVTIDRCKGHGVWFDAAELETGLVESTEPKQTGGWLKRLFGRKSST